MALVTIGALVTGCGARTGVDEALWPTDAQRLRLGTDTLSVYVVRNGQSVSTGQIVDQLGLAEVDGRTVLRRIYQRNDRVLGAGVDTIIDEYPTLRPILHLRRDNGKFDSLHYGAGRVAGLIVRNGQPTSVDRELGRDVINYATWDLFLRASPLVVGDSIHVAAHLPGEGIVHLRAWVRGSEFAKAERGVEVDAWVVEGDFVGLPVTFWIAKESRHLVKQVMRRLQAEILFVRRGAT